MRLMVVLIGVVLVLGWSVPAVAQGNCTTRWNQWLQQYETSCSDGSRSVDKYNPWLKQWDTRTTPGYNPQQPFQPQQRCTTKYNQWLRQWETHCD